MGCDGGSIPRRDEMVKLKKKAEKAERDVELAAKWRHCALSAEKLKEPIVACDLGRLYNKESILMALLDKSNIPEVASHIRNLKDVTELKLTVNPGYKPSDKADGYNDVQAAQYVCPVTGLEMSGRYRCSSHPQGVRMARASCQNVGRFAFLRGCGCVVSEKALKEVPSATCHKCGAPFSNDDVATINGTDEDVKRQRESMEERRLQAKQAKLAKRKRKTESQPDSETDGSADASDLPDEKKPKLDAAVMCTSTAATSSSTSSKLVNGSSKVVCKGSKVSSKQNSASGSKTLNGSGNGSTLRAGSSASVVVKKATQELSSSFKSAEKDPNARDAYKSLFHSKDKERPKEKSAHWVTFFPYH